MTNVPNITALYHASANIFISIDILALHSSDVFRQHQAQKHLSNIGMARELPKSKWGGARVNHHEPRRTCVSGLLDAGADTATVAPLVGHSNLNTTRRYDCRPEQTKQNAAGLLHIPYHRRAKG